MKGMLIAVIMNYSITERMLADMGINAPAEPPSEESKKEFIENHIKTFKELNKPMDEEHCPICLDGYHAEDKVVDLDCKHVYHSDCIEEYLTQYNYTKTCPICRETIEIWSRRGSRI